jgi:hypothetical protein
MSLPGTSTFRRVVDNPDISIPTAVIVVVVLVLAFWLYKKYRGETMLSVNSLSPAAQKLVDYQNSIQGPGTNSVTA